MNTKKHGDELIHKVRKIQTMNDNVSIGLDEIEYLIKEHGVPGAPRQPSEYPPSERAWRFQISYDDVGTASVTVNDSQPFRVPPVLAVLLDVLAQETGDANRACVEDSLVPFKTYDEILPKMTEALGREFTERALKQAVCRLRRILERRGFAGLLQTNRLKRGYRLAVWRKKDAAAVAWP